MKINKYGQQSGMKKFLSKKWFGIPLVAVIAVLLVGVVFALPLWNSANLHGTGTVTVTTTPVTQPTASFSGTITSDSISIGTVATGATLDIGGVSTVTHTLGIASASVSNIVPDTYGFSLTSASVTANSAALTTYFSGLTGTNLTQITAEINGTAPFFFLNISGSTVSVYDGFQRGLNSSSTAPLVINDNYPVGTYTYTGTLVGANGASPLLVTVTLIVAEPTVWEIGGNIVTGNPTVQLTFNSPTVAAGAPINVTATLGVTDIGSTAISGWNLTNLVYPLTGTGWNLTVSQTPVTAGGGTATLTFTLTGTAPANAASIDLSGVSCTLTPVGP